MSFKCSVFGHRYGDPDVEREREEQGSEVVITIKETETCKRCGETRVVSENKEVTTLETPSDIVGDDIADEDDEQAAASAEPPAETPEPTANAPEPAVEGGDDAELIDDAESSSAETEDTGTASDFDPPDLGPEGDATADTDEDDAVILEEDDGDDADDEREPGQWPDEAEADTEDDESEDWTPSTGQDLRPVEEEQPDIQPTNTAVTVPDGEFYCPECDFTTDVESSSLRAGDFCPECHRGSLTHRSDEG
jgi:hypothetical protein